MKNLFCILFCLSLLGCNSQSNENPPHLLSREKMVQILADVHTAEATIENRVVYPDTALMTFNHLEREILKKHGVKEQDFRDTYNHYLNNLKEMDKLYEIIIDTLSVRESKARIKTEGDSTARPAIAPAEPPTRLRQE